MDFKIHLPYSPAGDQPQAIDKLVWGLNNKLPHQALLGVTGSGKTFTLANVIAKTNKPTLVISHNKTLAAQLYQEFREYFPENGVGYFVSYYDYYQPEAYIPQTDTYIAKEADINSEIDKLRLQATSLLFSRKDVIIVASVSCIYNLGSPVEYKNSTIILAKGKPMSQDELLDKLISMHYVRSRIGLDRGMFRVRGGKIEVVPAYSDEIIRIYLEKGLITKIEIVEMFNNKQTEAVGYIIYPAKHFIANKELLKSALGQIRQDLKVRLTELKKEKKNFEAERLEQRVNYDLEMIAETGYVNGIENYSRYFDGRKPNDPPWTLVDYFRHIYGDNFLTIIDESHITVPQIGGMFAGDLSRKKMLIDFGFRLPSCLDNRPLRFEEFSSRVSSVIYDSATPDEWEVIRAEKSANELKVKSEKFKVNEESFAHNGVVEQLIRPTGLVDPEIDIRKSDGQIQDLIKEIVLRKEKGERVLVTTLTKKMAEELSNYLADEDKTGTDIAVHYLHSDVNTMERTDILADLRGGKYDVIVGVNLLREGLDLPEVSLVAVIDADKQGFLRSKTSLIQTMGRAARHISGKVILYADEISAAMKGAIEEVERRRKTQIKYNLEHKITPVGITKPIRDRLVEKREGGENGDYWGDWGNKGDKKRLEELTPGDKKSLLPKLKKEMRLAARDLDFEKAGKIRDLITKISLPHSK